MPTLAPERRTRSLKDRTAARVPASLTHRLSADAPTLAARLTNTAQTVSAPGARDLTIDVLRAVAILAVAIGHWLVVVPSYAGGRFDGVNALATVPLMRWLSWGFQVMPLFFVVGGVANGASWRGARVKGSSYVDWLRTRLVRLARPTSVLFAVWALAAVGLRLAGVDPSLVQRVAWLVVVPVWFLAVYVVVVVLAPAMLRLYERFGLWTLVLLASLAMAVDIVRFNAPSTHGVEHTNFLWVFLFCQQLGFFWLDDRLRARRWVPAALLGGGVAALLALTHLGPYPLSMVGVPGERIANNAPPTVALLVLGLAQAGLGVLLRPTIERLLTHRVFAGAALALNRNAMTILLWHFTALVLAALVLLPRGVVPVFEPGSAAFWAVRLVSLAVNAVPLAGLVLVFGRFERRRTSAPVTTLPSTASSAAVDGVGAATAVGAALLLAASCLVITLRGLNEGDAWFGFPMTAAALFVAGVTLVGRQPVGVGSSSEPLRTNHRSIASSVAPASARDDHPIGSLPPS